MDYLTKLHIKIARIQLLSNIRTKQITNSTYMKKQILLLIYLLISFFSSFYIYNSQIF